jgi:hypothetical protein
MLNCLSNSCPICIQKDVSKVDEAKLAQMQLDAFATFFDKWNCWEGQIADRPGDASVTLEPRDTFAGRMKCSACNTSVLATAQQALSCRDLLDVCTNLWSTGISRATFDSFWTVIADLANCPCTYCGSNSPSKGEHNQAILNATIRALEFNRAVVGLCWDQSIAFEFSAEADHAPTKEALARLMQCGGKCSTMTMRNPVPTANCGTGSSDLFGLSTVVFLGVVTGCLAIIVAMGTFCYCRYRRSPTAGRVYHELTHA